LSQGAAGGAAGGDVGNPVHGELSPAFHAPLFINGQNSREVIRAVGERLAELNNALRAASIQRGDHVTFGGMDTGDGHTEVPRPSWNKQWLSVVLTFAKDRKYNGLSLVP
jgi:hypothetical protein